MSRPNGRLSLTAVVAIGITLAVLLGTAGQASAYQVAPGSSGNRLVLAIDDRASMTKDVTIEADVLALPSWVLNPITEVTQGRLTTVEVRFDVADIAPGARGHIEIGVRGLDGAGGETFSRSRLFPLSVRGLAPSVQEDFDVLECCLDPAASGEAPLAPEHHVLVGATPNPFVALTNIVFGLAVEGGRVDLDVFDVQGRRIRSMSTSRLSGGYHRISWDGRDESGRDMPAGAYFCRLSCGSWSQTTRADLVR